MTTAFEFDTRSFVRSHGREPKGRGSWMFRFNAEKAEHQVPGSLTYADAKKAIRAIVKANAPDCEFALITILP